MFARCSRTSSNRAQSVEPRRPWLTLLYTAECCSVVLNRLPPVLSWSPITYSAVDYGRDPYREVLCAYILHVSPVPQAPRYRLYQCTGSCSKYHTNPTTTHSLINAGKIAIHFLRKNNSSGRSLEYSPRTVRPVTPSHVMCR